MEEELTVVRKPDEQVMRIDFKKDSVVLALRGERYEFEASGTTDEAPLTDEQSVMVRGTGREQKDSTVEDYQKRIDELKSRYSGVTFVPAPTDDKERENNKEWRELIRDVAMLSQAAAAVITAITSGQADASPAQNAPITIVVGDASAQQIQIAKVPDGKVEVVPKTRTNLSNDETVITVQETTKKDGQSSTNTQKPTDSVP